MNSSEHKIKRALISVSDKTGIVDFAKELDKLGIGIISTGGTAKKIMEAGISVKAVSEITGFPEIMDGRVKTLHPKVHAGLLSDLGKSSHLDQMKELDINSIDLLVVNLYPFEKTLAQNPNDHDNLIENIDIGGPAMLRAAAKNYKWTAPIVNPENYQEVLNQIKATGSISEEFRLRLSAETFEHTAHYDTVISNYLSKKIQVSGKYINISYPKGNELRYGENPHQKAEFYGNFDMLFEKLHGKELSYNNLIDIDASVRMLGEFDDNVSIIVKHTNPSGVGLDPNQELAYRKAFATDTVSPFGGIISFNNVLDIKAAKAVDEIFTEVIIASDFSDESYELLTKKKNRRLLKYKPEILKKLNHRDFKSILPGLLVQDRDDIDTTKELKIVTKRKPTDEEMKSLIFGWKVCKHVKSNSIVYNRHDRTLGIGAGQMSRVDSSRIAVEKAKLMNLDLKGSTIASDAFFPFADGLLQAVDAGATAVIQPGGSVRDEEVIKAADDNNIAMVFTGYRHFKH